MIFRAVRQNWPLLLTLLGCLLIAACAGRARPNTTAAPDVPASFDLTLLADKDGNFDLDGSTLPAQDVIDHLRYRNTETSTPVKTLLLKRGEKQKVTDRHIGQVYRMHAELKIRTFVQEKDGGEISEIRAGSETQ